MTLKIAQISGQVTGNGFLNIARISGSVGLPGANGTLKIAKVSGTVGTTVVNPSLLKIARISGVITRGITLATPPQQTVKPFDIVRVDGILAPGSPAPDTWTFTLVTNSQVHTLQLDGTTSYRTFIAPARLNGCTVQLTIVGTLGGVDSAPVTAIVQVAPHNDFIWNGTRWVGITKVSKLIT